MPRDNRARVGLDVNVGRGGDAPEPLESAPFRIAILGDFGGRDGGASDASPGIADRKPARVDRDDVDKVLAAWAPRLRLAVPGSAEGILSFAKLDDFHPDALYERLPLFQSLRRYRKELADPSTFAQAAAGLSERKAPKPASAGPAREIPANLLDEIVGESSPEAAFGEIPGGDLHTFIQRAMAPYLVPNIAPQQNAMLAQVDATIGGLMRALLRDAGFRALEALWRSVSFLVRRIETSADLQIHLIDISRAELEADLKPDQPAERSALYQVLSDAATEGPWALLTGAYTFGEQGTDIALLERVASLARSVGAPWISAAHPRLVGCSSVADLSNARAWGGAPAPEWNALRRAEVARWLGLVLPRFLLRLPYGADAEECERFAFEELAEGWTHEDLLWGNPAMACAFLLAQSFESAGWGLRPGSHLHVDGLPLHLGREAGSTTETPCAEVLMTDESADRLMAAGVMPLASMKGQDVARLVRFQSVAEPLAQLAGRWAPA